MDCQKHSTKSQTMKNMQPEIKPIKIGKRLGVTYCFGCTDFQATRSKNDKYLTQGKIKLCCLSIKKVKIFKTKAQQLKLIKRFTD